MYVKHNYFIVYEATCFDLLNGHHQALQIESTDSVYTLGSQRVHSIC